MAASEADKILMKAFGQFGELYIKELKSELERLDKKASGDLINSLDSKVISTAFGTKFTIQILALDYLEQVDEGRKAGLPPPPVEDIRKWTKYKGIPESAAYPIAKSIGIKGIEPTDVIKNTLQKFTTPSNLGTLDKPLLEWLETTVDNFLVDISKNKNITIS